MEPRLRHLPFAILLLLAGHFPSGPVSAQEAIRDTDSLQQRLAIRVDSIFSTFDNSRSPGCAVGVLTGDELSFARGYGMANLDHGLAITPQTVFRTGSVSKQFTAAVVVLLAQEGALSLDDNIRFHLPELPEYEAPITIRHLLHHTSGLRDYLELMAMRGVGDEATYSEDDVVELLARQELLNFSPGSRFLYSNSGYLLLSRIVEKATGRTLREQARRLLFDPLGMEVSHYHDNHHEVVPMRATGYGLGPKGQFVVDLTTLDIIGDGGVFTSITELARWMRNFWTLEAGDSDWLEVMETRGVPSTGDTLSYALGLRHDVQRGLPYIGHGGAFVGYRAATLRYPSEETAVMVLCNYNRVDAMGLARAVGAVVLEDRMGPTPERADPSPSPEEQPPPPSLSQEEAESFLGEYYSPEVDATLRIFQGEDGLMLDVNGGWDLPLTLREGGGFQAGYLTLVFETADGRVTGFRSGSRRAGGILFTKQ